VGIEEILQLEIHRARWWREREACSLVNPDDEGFAMGRLPLPGPDPLVRLLIFPADPEAERLTLDDSFWDWFTGDLPDPAIGRPADWGLKHRPTSGAALRYQPYGRDECSRYLAVHRSGGLEMGLGRDAGSVAEPLVDVDDGPQAGGRGAQGFLRLVTTVGRVWAAAAAYGELLARWPGESPFQVVLGVRRTQGMVLCNFGTGWAEPGYAFAADPITCLEPGLLRLLEFASWPDEDGIQALAFDIGSWLENAFGSRYRRYLAHSGPLEGQFDRGRYGW
jgi:hypothetical protein